MNSGPKYLVDWIGSRRTMVYFRIFVTQELAPIRQNPVDDHGILLQGRWK